MPRILITAAFRLAGILTLLPAIATAQGTDAARQAELIDKLLQRIDQLEKRVTELETTRPVTPGLAAVPAPAPQPLVSAAPASPVMTATAHDHDTAPPVDAGSTTPMLRLSGFGDINYTASDRKGTHGGFNEGQFILHISSALSSRVSYFGELSMTARTDAGTGTPPATGFNVEVERSIIRYDQSDRLKLSFGRYHTPISYWNTEFHHGSWLQTTASRPEMIQFGGNFIPVHFVGALAEGSASAGGLNLNYNVGIGNGRSSVLSRDGDWGDVNNHKAWLANVFIKPDKIFGLHMGAAVYRDKIDVAGRPQSQEWIESAHVAWTKESPEFIAEFFNITHRQTQTGFVSNNQAWYAQFAYRLPAAGEKFKPYYRYEYIHTPQSDAIFRGLNLGLSGSTLGLRYDISSFSALKLEYRRQARPGVPDFNVVWAQTSFTF